MSKSVGVDFNEHMFTNTSFTMKKQEVIKTQVRSQHNLLKAYNILQLFIHLEHST